MAESADQPLPSLGCELAAVAGLPRAVREEMFVLMTAHFERIDRTQFLRDLDEKRSAILVRDAQSGRLRGFGSITRYETTLNGQRLAAVFAGDTVMEPDCWGHAGWLFRWAQHGYELACESPADYVALVLLTSTHRSYKFLPGFFREYYPTPSLATPENVRQKLAALVRVKFPQEYDATTGVVQLTDPTPVREERADPAAEESDDPHARYFRQLNPGYAQGNFLACVAEFTWANLSPLGRRVVRPA
jgi:hypothetical protein